eukprot:6016061-Pleurochrysis_carterae.AAC.1
MAGFPLTHEGGAATVAAICKHAAETKKTVRRAGHSAHAPFAPYTPSQPRASAHTLCWTRTRARRKESNELNFACRLTQSIAFTAASQHTFHPPGCYRVRPRYPQAQVHCQAHATSARLNASAQVCMNVSAPFIAMVPPFRAALLEAFKYCTYAFCNESEAEQLAKELGWTECTDTKAIALKMATLPSEVPGGLTAVVTQGAPHTPMLR